MDFDLSQALASLRGMAASFVAFLPDLALAPIVYLTERRRRHRNLGRVLGRLAQGGLMLVGPLVMRRGDEGGRR